MDKSPCDLLLKAACVVTQDDERRIIENAALAVTDGRIAGLGPAKEIEPRFLAAQSIDLGQVMLLPGLINTHTHAAMTIFRGLADDLPLHDWLTRHIWPVEKELTPELVRLGSLLACAEMIRFGTTTFQDMYFFTRETAKAVEECGLRAVLGEGVIDQATCSYPDAAGALAKAVALHEQYKDHPRIRAAIVAHSIYATSQDSLLKCAEISNKYDSLFTLHLAESAWETEDSLTRFAKRPLEVLRDLGLLGDRLLLAHCVHLNDAEIELLARTKTKVAHCPLSNAKLASGTARVQRMLAAKVVAGLGTDGAASNNSLNLFTEMRFASLTQKNLEAEPTALPASLTLDMATRLGACALNWPELGRLALGAPADIIGLCLDQPNLNPLYNPVSQAVYAASGAEVCLSMVEGKILFRDGNFQTLDFPGLLKEISGMMKWVKDRIK